MIALLALALPTLGADEPALADALSAELERNASELHIEGAPPIYHLRYQVLFLEQVDLRTSMGALVHRDTDPLNGLGIELRVGAPEFDNTGFGGWQNGFGLTVLPARPTPASVQMEAWRVTDQAYKQAVEQYARKLAQFTPPPDYPGDYTVPPALQVDLGGAEVGDADALEVLATRLSKAMVVEPPLERAEVYLGHEAGALWTLDTEGTRVRRPVEETTVRAVLHARADDGMLLTDHLLWTVRQPDDLPPLDQMVAQAREAAEAVQALAALPVLEDEYVGPVLFEESAAVDLFRHLLVPQLEGTPGEVPFDSWFGELGSDKDPVRLLRRVLPPGWTVVDDPRRAPAHPGAFQVDMEGSEAERVELVEDGIVRTVLMSRVPRKGVGSTNGHARGRPGTRLEGRASLMEVEAPTRLREAKLRKKALRLAASYGRDWVFVVRRLQEPAVRRAGSGLFGMGDDSRGSLPMPVSVIRLYADGREEPLRGASFAGVQRWVLRDLVAAGEQVEASFLAPAEADGGWRLEPTEGMPTWMSAPEVLVGEMELIPVPGDPREVPVLQPTPTAERTRDMVVSAMTSARRADRRSSSSR